MDERLRAIQREFMANPSEELAVAFMNLQCRLNPPSFCGKKVSDIKTHMTNVYGRLQRNLNTLGLKEDDPIERLLALDCSDLFSMWEFGSSSRFRLIKGLQDMGLAIPVNWNRYLSKHDPWLHAQLLNEADK